MMIQAQKIFALLLALIFITSFAFADIAVFPTPVESGLIFGFAAIFGIIVIAIVSGGLLLAFKVYSKLSKKNSDKAEKKIKDLFKSLIKGICIIFVIIFVLSIIVPMLIPPAPRGVVVNALDAISDAVSAAAPSGQGYAGAFVLKKDYVLSTTNLASKTDLDKDSFIFTMGEFTSEDKIETDGTYIKYTGDLPQKKLSAIVVCKPTNLDLAEALRYFASSKNDLNLASKGCINDGILCCVIIPTRSIN